MVQDIFKSLWERRNRIGITGFLENYLIRTANLAVMAYYRIKASHDQRLKCIMEEICREEYHIHANAIFILAFLIIS